MQKIPTKENFVFQYIFFFFKKDALEVIATNAKRSFFRFFLVSGQVLSFNLMSSVCLRSDAEQV